jgi:hypothetical protein
MAESEALPSRGYNAERTGRPPRLRAMQWRQRLRVTFTRFYSQHSNYEPLRVLFSEKFELTDIFVNINIFY